MRAHSFGHMTKKAFSVQACKTGTRSCKVNDTGIYLKLVSDEDDGLAAELLPDGIVEDVVSDMSI